MPAVFIRQLRTLALMASTTSTVEDRAVLQAQADMILRASEESVPEPRDAADIRQRYDRVVMACAQQSR
jgi:uncharacterized membrane protein